MSTSDPMNFDSTYEERVAIMIYDGGLTESEALQAAQGKTTAPPDPPPVKSAEQPALPGITPKTRSMLQEYYKAHGR